MTDTHEADAIETRLIAAMPPDWLHSEDHRELIAQIAREIVRAARKAKRDAHIGFV